MSVGIRERSYALVQNRCAKATADRAATKVRFVDVAFEEKKKATKLCWPKSLEESTASFVKGAATSIASAHWARQQRPGRLLLFVTAPAAPLPLSSRDNL